MTRRRGAVASTKRDPRSFLVRIEREIRCSAEVEVLADDEDNALAVALECVDAPRSGYWQEDTVIDQTHCVREVK